MLQIYIIQPSTMNAVNNNITIILISYMPPCICIRSYITYSHACMAPVDDIANPCLALPNIAYIAILVL